AGGTGPGAGGSPPLAGHAMAYSQTPLASPTYALRSPTGVPTDQSGIGHRAARTFACAAVASSAFSRYGPGSGPDSPAYRLPSPTPGSSATSRMSAGPPNGPGPLHATALARIPERSSPAQPMPVTIH